MPLDPNMPHAPSAEGRNAERLAAIEHDLRVIKQYLSGGSTQQFPVVSVLPTPGRMGRAVVLSTNGKLYIDSGTAWVAQA